MSVYLTVLFCHNQKNTSDEKISSCYHIHKSIRIYMELEFYLDSHGVERKDFAKQLGVCLSTFGNYRSGLRPIPLHLALKIELLTEGKVTVYDLAHLYKINPSK